MFSSPPWPTTNFPVFLAKRSTQVVMDSTKNTLPPVTMSINNHNNNFTRKTVFLHYRIKIFSNSNIQEILGFLSLNSRPTGKTMSGQGPPWRWTAPVPGGGPWRRTCGPTLGGGRGPEGPAAPSTGTRWWTVSSWRRSRLPRYQSAETSFHLRIKTTICRRSSTKNVLSYRFAEC